ncbi:BatD family protein [Candidatus Uabimicrobium sp. HlEnr_7]|uniref:BatD family protein n=1 Tax=Candidatus Uabimicrobium helgolandensis TaxID=3095367 RepID=UPI00355770FB
MNRVQTAIHYSQKGVITAYYYLIDIYSPVIYLLALTKLHDNTLAQKVTEEVFFRTYNNLNNFKNKVCFLKWIQVQTNKMCHNIILEKQVAPHKELQLLTCIPENHKICLLLRELYPSTEKIAFMLNIPEREVKYTHKKYSNTLLKKIPLSVDTQSCKNKITNKYRKQPFQNYLQHLLLIITASFFCFSLLIPFPMQFAYAFYLSFLLITCINKLYIFISRYTYSKLWKKLIIVLIMINVLYSQPEMWAGVDKQKVNEKDQVILTIIVSGKEKYIPSFSLTNLKQTSKPQTIVTTEIITNKQSTVIKYIYKLQPQKIGLASIVNIQCKGEKKLYTQAPINLEVVQQQSENFPRFFAQLQPLFFEVYQGQVCPIKLDFYCPYDTKIERLSFALKKSTSYYNRNLEQQIQALERQEVFIYKKISNNLIIIPTDSKKINIGLEKFEVYTFTTESKNLFDKEFGEDKDFNDDFFRKNPLNKDFGAKPVAFPLATSSLTLKVISLPNAPSNFIGAVGHFSATARWKNNSLTQLILSISGKGNLETITNTFLQKSDFFKVKSINLSPTQYLSNEELQVKRDINIQLEYIKKGLVAVHPYFCYFHPQQKKYKYIDISIAPVEVDIENKKIKPWWKNNAFILTLALITIVVFGVIITKTNKVK